MISMLFASFRPLSDVFSMQSRLLFAELCINYSDPLAKVLEVPKITGRWGQFPLILRASISISRRSVQIVFKFQSPSAFLSWIRQWIDPFLHSRKSWAPYLLFWSSIIGNSFISSNRLMYAACTLHFFLFRVVAVLLPFIHCFSRQSRCEVHILKALENDAIIEIIKRIGNTGNKGAHLLPINDSAHDSIIIRFSCLQARRPLQSELRVTLQCLLPVLLE